jgi:stage IV sporulation protein FB
MQAVPALKDTRYSHGWGESIPINCNIDWKRLYKMRMPSSLDFSIGRFPVRVHWSFLLIAVLIGLNSNLLYTLSWIVVVFISVLVHELGHAVVAERYGMFPSIQLHSMGGLTVFSRTRRLTHLQEIILSLAGPGFGFALGGLVFVLTLTLGSVPQFLRYILAQMLWVNIGWGVINLVPMLPLDGGQVMRSLWQWIRNPFDERTPLLISIAVGVLAVAAGLWFRQIWLAALAAWFTYNNFMRLQGGRPPVF